jgi:hypothetical protein
LAVKNEKPKHQRKSSIRILARTAQNVHPMHGDGCGAPVRCKRGTMQQHHAKHGARRHADIDKQQQLSHIRSYSKRPKLCFGGDGMTRTETIIANAFKLPSFVTPGIEALLGDAMKASARKSGQFMRLPEIRAEVTGNSPIDHKVMTVLANAGRPMERSEIADAMGVLPKAIHASLQRLRARGTINAVLKLDRKYLYSMGKVQ